MTEEKDLNDACFIHLSEPKMKFLRCLIICLLITSLCACSDDDDDIPYCVDRNVPFGSFIAEKNEFGYRIRTFSHRWAQF